LLNIAFCKNNLLLIISHKHVKFDFQIILLLFKIISINLHPNFLGGIQMNYMKHFIIPFSGLKAGNHPFTFEIEDEFFEHFEYSEIKKGKVNVACMLDKQARMMVLYFDLSGKLTVPCDRCGEEFDLPVEGSQKLIVKFGADHQEESEDILVITEKEHELDVSQFLYEYVVLMLPIKKVHGTDEHGNSLCDPEVTRYIKEVEDHPADPRWEVLRKLKDQNKENEN
jgi:uncharacterized protein